jgi:outer membrane protein assembly factor BamB
MLWAAVVVCASTRSSGAAVLIPQTVAARYGLTRAWFAQIGSPQTTGTLAHVSLNEGMLLVQSTSGMLSALDAETGRTLWATQVGPSHHLSSEPAANEKFVVVVNGSVLFVLDRTTGHILWQRSLGGTPGAGPGVTKTHAFVPMVTGLIEGYDLEKGVKQIRWVYKSAGRVLIPPMTTGQTVSWATEKGYFYVADPAGKGVRYRLETRGAIQARPGYWTPNLYACSTDGSLYAVNETSGKIIWRYSVGDAIYTSPVAIEGKVFVASETTGLYCLDAKAADQLWNAPGIRQFVAASPTRVYASDQLGRLAILDSKRGTRLGTMPLDGIALKLVNGQSDRVYLVSDSCLVQCLRQADLKAPVLYSPPPPPTVEGDKDKPKRPVDKPTDTAAEPKDDSDSKEPADDETPAVKPKQPEEPAGDDPFK